jgi:hypothetical protein
VRHSDTSEDVLPTRTRLEVETEQISKPEVNSSQPSTEAEEALLLQILKKGNQCLSQASLDTGFGVSELRTALHRLLERGLVRERAGQEHRSPELRSFELNV